MRLKTVFSICLVGLLGIACGSSSKGGGGGGGSYSDIADSIAHPTGTLAAGNAKSVADEYAKISGTGAAGERIAASTDQTIGCPSGGNYSISASGNSSSARAVISYNDCCYSEGCCLGGGGTWYYSTQQGSAAGYSYCADYSVDYTCGGNYSLDYSGCFGANGQWTYVVEVDGETFAVSGSYSGGNGTLTITGANGTYTCTYTNGSGSCTGDGNFSF